MSKQERARRQRVMMKLRSWMEGRGISRREVAAHFGITTGHLSTLINANRTPSEAQVDEAIAFMELGVLAAHASLPKPPKPTARKRIKGSKTLGPSRPRITPKDTRKLRPLTIDEIKFVKEVAESWIKDNGDADQDEFVAVVRALSLGIRS